MALANWNHSYNNPIINKFDIDVYSYVLNSPAFLKETSPKTILEEELFSVYNMCDKEDWDFDGALPIPYKRYEQAKQFINFIEKFPKPKIIPYPYGTIGFDWKIKDYNISVVFEKDNYFLFIIMSPNGEKYGKELQNFENQSLFSKMLENLIG